MSSVDDRTTEELTERIDVHSLISNVTKEAEDVQQLLRDIIKKTKDLENDVVGFHQRDAAEEGELLRISENVARSEMNALKNLHYVEFVHRHAQKENSFTDGIESKQSGANGGSKSLKRSWFAQLAHGAPDAGFRLCDYGNVVEVLLGWRSLAQTPNLQLKLLEDDLDRSVPNLSSYVLMVNGFLCTTCYPIESCEFTKAELDEIMKSYDNNITLGDIYLRWNNVILRRSRLNKKFAGGNLGNLLDSSTVKSLLVGDGNDILTVVRHSQLENTAVFRGFFFFEELRGIESIGAQVNVLPSLLKSCKGKSQEYLEACVIELFKNFQKHEGHLLSQYKNVVVTLAMRDQNPCNGDTTCWKDYIVLDMRPLAPTIPFGWYFTWADVCALGQISSDRNLLQTFPIFKMTRVQVSTLEAYDVLSKKLFPVLNQLLHLAGHKYLYDTAFKLSKFAAVAATIALASAISAAIMLRKPFV